MACSRYLQVLCVMLKAELRAGTSTSYVMPLSVCPARTRQLWNDAVSRARRNERSSEISQPKMPTLSFTPAQRASDNSNNRNN